MGPGVALAAARIDRCTAIAGFFAAIPLLANGVLAARGRAGAQGDRALVAARADDAADLELRAEQDGTRTAQVMSGFTLDEMATRVAALLGTWASSNRFGKLVVVLGHDSSASTTRYFPAYSCGACGRRSRRAQRAAVRAHGQSTGGARAPGRPAGSSSREDTLFVGGLSRHRRRHDRPLRPPRTCADAAPRRALGAGRRARRHVPAQRARALPRFASAPRGRRPSGPCGTSRRRAVRPQRRRGPSWATRPTRSASSAAAS